MFVLLIGLPGPRIAVAHARVVSVHKILVVRQYFTPTYARALTSQGAGCGEDEGWSWGRAGEPGVS